MAKTVYILVSVTLADDATEIQAKNELDTALDYHCQIGSSSAFADMPETMLFGNPKDAILWASLYPKLKEAFDKLAKQGK